MYHDCSFSFQKWVRISQRRGRKQPPRCELCHYQFMRHKQFKVCIKQNMH